MWKLRKLFFVLLFATSSNAAQLTCQFGNDPSLCYPFTLTSVTQVNEDIIVTNPPFTPYIDNLTTNLIMESGFDIQQFPRKLFEIFTNVRSFRIGVISSTELGTDSFFNCEKLKHIEIFDSTIKHIGARFARTCSNVTHFSAYNNNFETIDENAFEGLTNLEILNLNGNKITCLPGKLFQTIRNIQQMTIGDNMITAIHSQLFANLEKLSFIAMNGNLIGYLPNLNLTTTGTSQIQGMMTFQLNSNPIMAISPNFLPLLFNNRITPTNDLKIFFSNPTSPASTCIDPNNSYFDLGNYQGDLHYIGITSGWTLQDALYQNSTTCYSSFTPEMGSDSLVTCANVLTTTTSTTTPPPGNPMQCATDKICRYYLDWNNQYTCVIDGAEGTVTSISGTHYLSFTDSDLTRLYFTNSHLSKVPNVLFQKFPNLKYLHVRNSGLSVINDQTFNECGNLEFLDASDNEIFRVEETALKNCTKLKIIDLTGNEIDHVSVGLYQSDPSLQRVHLRRLSDWILA